MKPSRQSKAIDLLLNGRYAAALLAAVCLCGCVINRPYPAAWPPLPDQMGGDCRTVEGEYEGLPIEDLLGGSTVRWRTAAFAPIRYRISFSNPTQLKVAALSGDDELISRTFNADANEFACDQGRLIVRPGGQWKDADVGIVQETPTLTFIDAGHYLVVQRDVSTIGELFFIPIWGKEHSWQRFPRIRR